MRLRLLAAASLLVACSERTVTVEPDAGSSSATETELTTRLAQIGAVDARIGTTLRARPASEGLVAVDRGFASAAFRATRPEPSHLGALFPSRADGTLRFSPGRVESWTLRLSPRDARPVTGAVDAGRLVFTEAWPSTDLVATSDARSAEWFLVLRDATAPRSFRWHVELGTGLHPQTGDDGRIDLLDPRGDAALRIEPVWAIDAQGKKTPVTMRLEGDELRLEVDTRDATWPVVVDPLVSVPVWLSKGNAPWTGRTNAAVAYTTGGVVVFGGEFSPATGSYSKDAWQWNGTSWTDIVDPSAASPVAAPGVTWKNKFVTVSGCSSNGCAIESSTGWIFDGASWSPFCGGTAATCGVTGRGGHALAAANGQLLVLGGLYKDDTPPFATHYLGDGVDGAGFAFADLWILEATASTNTFVKYTPTGARPTARFNAAMAGSDTDVLLFGGRNDWSGFLGDTWMWKKTGTGTGAWTCVCGCIDGTGALQICPVQPAPRASAGLAWDSARKKFVLFGGTTFFGSTADGNDDTWELDPTTKSWTPLCGGAAASCGSNMRNQSPQLAFDPSRRRMVQTAGTQSGSLRSATFELYVRGGSCSLDTDCDANATGTTGYCSEGTCCEVASCPQCKTCASAGSPGTCTNIAAGQPDTRAGKTCAACDGAGGCKTALGKTCALGSDCASGYCVDGVCCGTSTCASGYTCAPSGTCQKKLGQTCSSAGDCGSGNCVNAVCCSTSSCATGSRCDFAGSPGVCAKSAGQACTASAECGSGFCADGVCCNSACSGQCAACDVTGSVGTCIAIVGAPHGTRSACAGAGPCRALCNGSDVSACHYPDAASTCGSPSCAAGVQTAAGHCDGAGSCAQTSASCGAYSCSGTSCGTTCKVDGDCATGNYCKSNVCAPKEVNGVTCTSAAVCASGNCTDGVCCGSASCSGGARCDVAGALGRCSKPAGTACTSTSDCGGGHCVDGFCCDTACNGQCEACNVTGSEGACTPVVGAPHEARKACDDLGATDCAKKACDGVVRDKCNGFSNGTSTSCGADTCTTDKRFQRHGNCDGKGACSLSDPRPCTPYACDATASSGCKSACTSADDCAEGFACEGGACIQGARCSEDGVSSIAKTGEATSCLPFKCGTDGNCLKACASSADCASGTVCDTSLKACIVSTTTADDGGGCAMGTRSSPSGALALFALTLLGLLRRTTRAREH